MKPSSTAGLITVTAIAAFFLGRISDKAGTASPSAADAGPGPRASGASSVSSTRSPQGGGKAPSARSLNSLERIPVEKARQLTSKERLELMEKGALIYDSGKQADLLCGVISTLTKDDIAQAVGLLGAAQDRGNFCSQAVWDAIWTQWGRVDPQGVLKEFNDKLNGKSRADARHVMAGWWDADPEGALAWAKEPKESHHDAVAASLALTNSAGGDPQKLEQIMLGMPAGDARMKECLRDYLDLAGMKPGEGSAAQVYDSLPGAMKDAAWSVVLQRLSYAEPDATADWLTKHVSDPGFDVQISFTVVQRMVGKDPETALKLASLFPANGDGGIPDAANYAISVWSNSNLPASIAWLKSQPSDSPIAQRYLPVLESRAAQQQGRATNQEIIWSDPSH